jgi:RimJ/RimL family protein N-acetyltransferase
MKLIPIDASGLPADMKIMLPERARDACAQAAALYRDMGFQPPWIGYLAQVDHEMIGTCAFKAPVRAGRVEIAFFTFADSESQAYATLMVKELLKLAAQTMPGVLVVAHTLPQENASNAVLKRAGFWLAGLIEHPEDGMVWEWHVRTDEEGPGATPAP